MKNKGVENEVVEYRQLNFKNVHLFGDIDQQKAKKTPAQKNF